MDGLIAGKLRTLVEEANAIEASMAVRGVDDIVRRCTEAREDPRWAHIASLRDIWDRVLAELASIRQAHLADETAP